MASPYSLPIRGAIAFRTSTTLEITHHHPQNPTDTQSEYGSCNFDVTHNLTVSGVVISPQIKSNRLLNQIAGGWQVSPLITVRTGTPYTITLGSDNSLTGVGQDRPNVVQGVNPYAKNLDPTPGSGGTVQPVWFNKAALAVPTTGTFGNYRPFSQRGPGYANVDVAISKHFALYERANLGLRGEAFNALNHPNYANPVSAGFTSSTFGRITSMANEARLLQIATKINF